MLRYLPSRPSDLIARSVDGESIPTLIRTYSGGSILIASRSAAMFLFGESYPTCSTVLLPGHGSAAGPTGANSCPTAGYTTATLSPSKPRSASSSSFVLREFAIRKLAAFRPR